MDDPFNDTVRQLVQELEDIEDQGEDTEDSELLTEASQAIRESLYQGTDGYWHSLTLGGRVKPEHIYNKGASAKVYEALEIVEEFLADYDRLAGGEN